jgi:DinB superfamily
MDGQAGLRQQLVRGLRGADTHMPFEEAVRDFPAWGINAHPPNVPYSPWHLLEHLRLTQSDILAYVTDPGHVSPPWPAGYWPAVTAEATPEQFAATITAFLADRAALEALVLDPATDLLAPLAHAPEHTILREARIVANHNSYHLGEFAILRQVMGSWGPRNGQD